MSEPNPRSLLGAFIRAHRERLPVPTKVAGRRRTPGWRREELADAAGVGVTWITWLEQGRDVFAVPGSIKEAACRGSNRLIKDGAKLIERAQDVLDEILPQLDARQRARLKLDGRPGEAGTPLRREDLLVYEALSYEARSVDAVIESTGLSAAQVSATLLSLELNGRIRQLPGQQYIRL